MEYSNFKRKITAVGEVTLVTFFLVPFLTLGIYRLFPRFESWQTETLGFPFPVLVYGVMVGLSLLAILLRRKKLADYGIHFRGLKPQLDIAAACFIPIALANVPLGLGVNHTTWRGAILLAAVQVGLLLILALILRKKPSLSVPGITAIGMFLLPFAPQVAGAAVGKAIILFLTYAVFVGFGEEILYRGYMQSRLDEVFGQPYRFFEVSFGWGAAITALLFGLTHVGILRWILGLDTEITLAWGFWTIFSGLVFSFVREKSGSILAPALLHGLPQAIASAAVLILS